jgi:hypothetical protein
MKCYFPFIICVIRAYLAGRTILDLGSVRIDPFKPTNGQLLATSWELSVWIKGCAQRYDTFLAASTIWPLAGHWLWILLPIYLQIIQL